MYRLATKDFKHNKELNDLIKYCLSETIKVNIESYFNEGFEKESNDNLYKKVNIDFALELIDYKFQNEMKSKGIEVETFLAKKIAQMLIQVRDTENEYTFDIFNEYLLYKMVVLAHKKEPVISENATNKIEKLRELLINEVIEGIEYYEIEDSVKESELIFELVTKYILFATDFLYLLGTDESDNDFAFWDYDFKLFDKLGFERCINEICEFKSGGYDEEYIKNIFTSVGEDFPFRK